MTGYVVSRDEVPHLWAHKSQDHARTQTGNFYFEGETIYSYGDHFPIARHVGNVVLLTTREYSVTTARQVNDTRWACKHIKTFFVDNVMAFTKGQHKDNFNELKAEYEARMVKACRARSTQADQLAQAEAFREACNDYAEHFKIGVRMKPANTDKIKARAKKEAAERKAEREEQRQLAEERARREKANFDEKLAKWRNGQCSTYNLGQNRHDFPVALRINGDTVETTHGANFPLYQAMRALPMVKRCQRSGKAWKRNGEQIRLGHYQIDRISETGDVTAGCHFVTFSEIQHFETLL